MAHKFPFSSPYVVMNNNPIRYIDPNGMEWYEVTEEYEEEDEDGNKVTKTRKKWKYYADTKEKSIWNGEYDDSGNKVMNTVKGLDMLFTFDGSKLSFLMEDGGITSWSAVSGILDEFGNTQPGLQFVPNAGPIPEGMYSVNPGNIQRWCDLSFVNKLASWIGGVGVFGKHGAWPGGTVAWGEQRLPLVPLFSVPGGRGKFFIHGGLVPGSIGCIDLAGNNASFFHTLNKQTGKIKLSVGY